MKLMKRHTSHAKRLIPGRRLFLAVWRRQGCKVITGFFFFFFYKGHFWTLSGSVLQQGMPFSPTKKCPKMAFFDFLAPFSTSRLIKMTFFFFLQIKAFMQIFSEASNARQDSSKQGGAFICIDYVRVLPFAHEGVNVVFCSIGTFGHYPLASVNFPG